MKNKNLGHFLSIHRHSHKHVMHLIDIVGKSKDQRRKSKVFLDKPSLLKRIRRSIVARINIQFWKYTIPFGSINPESRSFLRFRSGASTPSLVASYDFVREHQPEVSYLPTIPFGSINPESRIFLRFRSGASTRSLVSFYDSVREHQPGVSYLPMIPFGSINPESRTFLRFRYLPTILFGSINLESRIFLRFCSGVSTRSLIFFLQFHSRCDNL